MRRQKIKPLYAENVPMIKPFVRRNKQSNRLCAAKKSNRLCAETNDQTISAPPNDQTVCAPKNIMISQAMISQ